jgi:hypothetical protein
MGVALRERPQVTEKIFETALANTGHSLAETASGVKPLQNHLECGNPLFTE